MNIKFYVETNYEKGLLLSVEDAQSLMGILSRAEHVDSSGYGDEMKFTRRKELLLKQFRVLSGPKIDRASTSARSSRRRCTRRTRANGSTYSNRSQQRRLLTPKPTPRKDR